jgi:hypothetical protein
MAQHPRAIELPVTHHNLFTHVFACTLPVI